MATAENYKSLFDDIIDLEDQKKEISKDIKERIDAFCGEHGVSQKGVKQALREYKEYLKDQQAFHEMDVDRDSILDLLIGDAIPTVSEE